MNPVSFASNIGKAERRGSNNLRMTSWTCLKSYENSVEILAGSGSNLMTSENSMSAGGHKVSFMG